MIQSPQKPNVHIGHAVASHYSSGVAASHDIQGAMAGVNGAPARQLTPELRLVVAVVEQAYNDLAHPLHFRAAIAYFTEPTTGPFSFASACEILQLDQRATVDSLTRKGLLDPDRPRVRQPAFRRASDGLPGRVDCQICGDTITRPRGKPGEPAVWKHRTACDGCTEQRAPLARWRVGRRISA